MAAEKQKRSFKESFWPDVSTQHGAFVASRGGFWAAIFVAGTTALIGGLAAFGITIIPGFTAWSLADAGIAGVIALGIWRHSRFAAWSGLVVYLAERGYTINETHQFGSNPALFVVLVLGFISGVRGTHALAKMKQTPEGAQPIN